jgi:hypothetical protein
VIGLHHNGMHDWVLDEHMLGARVAAALDAEATGMGVWVDLSYAQYVREHG